MIQLTYSKQFNDGLESTLEWLYISALEEGKDPEQLQGNFQTHFLKTIHSLHNNPFMFSAYGPNNPTRSAIFFHGLYVIEYQLIPTKVHRKDSVEEVILTSILPTKSDIYGGAYEKIEHLIFDFDEE